MACDIGAYEFEGTPEEPESEPPPPPTGPDSDPPTATIDAKPALRTLDTFVEFRFRANEIARYECVLDPPVASFSGCESPHDYTNLALGLHTFELRAIDVAGNVGPAESYTWRVVLELDPPETTLAGGPPAATCETRATFTFGASEPATFECSLDGAAFAACLSPSALIGLAEGPHTFAVRVVDVWFNIDESPATHAWTVDTTPPDTTVEAGPSGLTSDSTPTFAFSSEAGASFECRVDAAAFATCGSPLTTAVLTDGTHTFEVRATDAAGNVDETPASRAFSVDTLAPDDRDRGRAHGAHERLDADLRTHRERDRLGLRVPRRRGRVRLLRDAVHHAGADRRRPHRRGPRDDAAGTWTRRREPLASRSTAWLRRRRSTPARAD